MTTDEILANTFCSIILSLQHAGRLGYVRPSDEWMDNGEPLPDLLQDAAHVLVAHGFLPEFEEYV